MKQCFLGERGRQVIPAKLVVNLVDYNIPHDRTHCLIGDWDIRRLFPGIFLGWENDFVRARELFRTLGE